MFDIIKVETEEYNSVIRALFSENIPEEISQNWIFMELDLIQ